MPEIPINRALQKTKIKMVEPYVFDLTAYRELLKSREETVQRIGQLKTDLQWIPNAPEGQVFFLYKSRGAAIFKLNRELRELELLENEQSASIMQGAPRYTEALEILRSIEPSLLFEEEPVKIEVTRHDTAPQYCE